MSGANRPVVAFLLPTEPAHPTGGSKVVFEYANGLAARGWNIRIVVPYLLEPRQIEQVRVNPFEKLRHLTRFQWRRWRRQYRPDWFELDPAVELRYCFSPEANCVPPAAAWLATWWRTAPWVAQYQGAGLYLIQHLETYGGPEHEVVATWRLPLRKIVIARWLEEFAHQQGQDATYIPNGLDFSCFGIDTPPEAREALNVMMLHHHEPWKGSADGIAALHIAKREFPALRATLFGVGAPPPELPSWIDYRRKPPQARLRELYNSASIFLGPSWVEGWGLPPAEAMMCGCALVATDNGGHREFARHEINALLSPIRQPEQLAANLSRLLGDAALRIRLARTGHRDIQRFTWNAALDRMEETLRQALSQRTTGAGAAPPA